MKKYVKIFKALSDVNRLTILKLLEKGKMCVCEITYGLGLSASTVSKHCSILKEADLIKDSKKGKWVHYEINNESDSFLVKEIIKILPDLVDDNENVKIIFNNIKKVTLAEICCSVIKTED